MSLSNLFGLSPLMSRLRLAMKAGIQFDGKRDLYASFGYNRNPTFPDYVAKYLRQDIARRVIDAPVKATWTDPPKVGGTKQFEAAWETLVSETNLYKVLAKVDCFAGLGQCAVIVVGLNDKKSLEAPATAASKVLYLQPYMENSISITEFDDDQTSPRFGMPTMYTITPGETQVGNSDGQTRMIMRTPFKVHYTRILHVADNTMENTVLGHSRMEHINNLLDDLLKIVGGSAETYWLTANRGMQVDVDKDMELSEQDAKDLSEEIEEYQHQLRRFIRTRGVKIESLGAELADPSGVFDVVLSILSAATQIPKRVLLGAEAGQLASQQDRANWAIYISERIANFAEPDVLRPMIMLLQAVGVLPRTRNAVTIEWPDAYKMSPLERAQTAAQMARSMANVTKALATCRNEVGVTVFSPEEARRVVGFGKHMPVFGDKVEGTQLPEPDPVVGTGAFGQPQRGAPATEPKPKPKADPKAK